MNKEIFICAPLIEEIHGDEAISSGAKWFNPKKIVWMESRIVGHDWERPYTIIKLEGEEPFMAEGDIEEYLKAIGVTVIDGFNWPDFDDNELETI